MTTAKFNYPPEFTTLPDYTAHSGQVVEVVRVLTPAEFDDEDSEPTMYRIRAADGWEGDAWESELELIEGEFPAAAPAKVEIGARYTGRHRVQHDVHTGEYSESLPAIQGYQLILQRALLAGARGEEKEVKAPAFSLVI